MTAARILGIGVLNLLTVQLGVAGAATFEVTSSLDIVDYSPGDGVCKIALFDICTLRAAIMEANALPGTTGINLPAGLYPLTETIDLDGGSGLPSISSAIEIIGAKGNTHHRTAS